MLFLSLCLFFRRFFWGEGGGILGWWARFPPASGKRSGRPCRWRTAGHPSHAGRWSSCRRSVRSCQDPDGAKGPRLWNGGLAGATTGCWGPDSCAATSSAEQATRARTCRLRWSLHLRSSRARAPPAAGPPLCPSWASGRGSCRAVELPRVELSSRSPVSTLEERDRNCSHRSKILICVTAVGSCNIQAVSHIHGLLLLLLLRIGPCWD